MAKLLFSSILLSLLIACGSSKDKDSKIDSLRGSQTFFDYMALCGDITLLRTAQSNQPIKLRPTPAELSQYEINYFFQVNDKSYPVEHIEYQDIDLYIGQIGDKEYRIQKFYDYDSYTNSIVSHFVMENGQGCTEHPSAIHRPAR